ncbi:MULTISPECIES: holo-ACP synthase [Bacillus]|uniref:holo-ACP synthase n=1 Tax=Bacillus TaxID=1386 RepID=UPI00028DD3C3|nr:MULTISPECIES: holo-ACP synthase [Bacillus]EKF34899.1 4'-phosphopantetheinyl transferase [Bacillus xiamenensis]MCW1837138.1 holo-ACP synthase [Bacillus xiamenensis]QGX67031.1 holo-ACP synthase [Bacillus sp. ms-22]
MIKGIGIDIVEIDRLSRVLGRQPRLPERILTLSEQDAFHTLSKKRQLEFLAGRFAAKEAFAKAYGTGIGQYLSFHDIEIQKDASGKPFIKSEKTKEDHVHLSITHTREYAAAQVLIERLSS